MLLNVRRDSLRITYFDTPEVGTHKVNYLLPVKNYTNMILDREMCTRYQKPEQIILIYRGYYTTASKYGTAKYNRINSVSRVNVLILYHVLMR